MAAQHPKPVLVAHVSSQYQVTPDTSVSPATRHGAAMCRIISSFAITVFNETALRKSWRVTADEHDNAVYNTSMMKMLLK